ncbi:MAG: tRNA epoxyqueuosine(34) reductase QueG [Bacteroidia bacterium]|nr:tRNA epoxyqueuosine(34) reductase QueG [Bacteroidia bacterium]
MTTPTFALKQYAKQLGFDYVGISKAEYLHEQAPRLEAWLKAQMHGEMQYMENHFDMRLDPRILVPGAKSVISLLYNYYPENKQINDTYKISKYAYGNDYHTVIKNKLYAVLDYLQSTVSKDIVARVFVDSAPVMEKAWAVKSGLGWQGKNANVINPKSGSFYFIAEIICDVTFEYDGAIKDYCGTCTRCIDACPTQAIVAPQVVDGSKCISYFTIELKNEMPSHVKNTFNDWVFGCDICQDVCPWNKFSKPHAEPLFNTNTAKLNLTKNDWQELTHDLFNELFKNSALKRAKYTGLQRNIAFIQTEK